MSARLDIDEVTPSIWRASERFPLTGVSRRACVLPNDEGEFPFGLTRLVMVEAHQPSRLEVAYDPESQMLRVGGEPVIAAHKTDIQCNETTTEDMQSYTDRVVDDSKDD
jgi:putative ATP-grasp target RiPP